ncbi:MAG: helix-turn-helix domain-containing protein [Erysipelotrichaceae bacterium]
MEQLFNASIGTSLRYIRLAKGYTLKEVSKEIGISTQYLAEIERCDKSVSYSYVNRILKFYKIDYKYNEEDFYSGKERLENCIHQILYENFEFEEEAFSLENFSAGFIYDLIGDLLKKAFLAHNFDDFEFTSSLFETQILLFPDLGSSCYYFVKGLYNESKKKNIEARENYSKALLLMGEDRMIEPLIRANLSANYLRLKNPLEAAKETIVTIKISQERGIFKLATIMNMNLGIVFCYLKQHQEAIKQFERTLLIAKRCKFKDIEEKISINMCLATLCLEKYKDAAQMARGLQKKYPEYTELEFSFVFSNLMQGIPVQYNRNSRLLKTHVKCINLISNHASKEADVLYDESLKILKNIEDDYFLKLVLLRALINIFEKKKNYDKAFTLLSYYQNT